MRGVVGLAALALALAGCGAAPSPQAAVSGSGEKGTDAQTARIVVTDDDMVTLSGAFELDGVGATLDDLYLEGGKTIWTEDAVYEPIPFALDAPTLSHVRWIKSDTTDYEPLLPVPSRRPADTLAFLATGADVREVGRGEERGEPVRRYSATLRPTRFLEGLPPERRDAVRETLDDYWLDWETGVPVELALDSKGRLRRADLVIYEEEPLVIEIFDYGVDVDATAPPAGEVITRAEYEERLRRLCDQLEDKGLAESKPYCGLHCNAGEDEGPAPSEVPAPSGPAAPTKPEVGSA